MKIIAGLGNPGQKYDKTKHNTGFMTMDHYLNEKGLSLDKDKFEGHWTKQKINGEDVILLEPQTFMNESGRSVSQVANFFKVDPADVLIIQDDMDMPIGKIRIRANGKSGGHNGIKSIISHVGTEKFKRVRVGIDHPQKMSVVDWVLSRFTKEQEVKLDDGLTRAVAAIDDWIENDDFMNTMNRFN